MKTKHVFISIIVLIFVTIQYLTISSIIKLTSERKDALETTVSALNKTTLRVNIIDIAVIMNSTISSYEKQIETMYRINIMLSFLIMIILVVYYRAQKLQNIK